MFDIEILATYGYAGLFLASFLAATILPMSSEIVLSIVLHTTGSDPWQCLIWTTIGNTLGGMTCYYMGYMGKIYWIEKYLGVKEEKIIKVQEKIKNKGAILAALTFLPVIGDVIAIALGFMRTNAWLVVLFMFIGKGLRYYVWILMDMTATALTL